MRIKSPTTYQYNSHRYRADIDDYRFFRDIVDDRTRKAFYEGDVIFIVNNPILELDIDKPTLLILNQLFWADYSWRRIGRINVAEFVMILNARVLSIQDQYNKYFKTIDMVQNPFRNFISSVITDSDTSLQNQRIGVSINKRDDATKLNNTSINNQNIVQTNNTRNSTDNKNTEASETAVNAKRFLNQGNYKNNIITSEDSTSRNTIHNNLNSQSRSSLSQNTGAENVRNMNTNDSINARIDTPQIKQGDFIGGFIGDIRGTDGRNVSINYGYITTADRSSNINNSLNEARSTNSTGSTDEVFNQTTEADKTIDFTDRKNKEESINSQIDAENSYNNTSRNTVSLNKSVDDTLSNEVTGIKSGGKDNSYSRTSSLVYADNINKVGETGRSIVKEKREGLQNMTLAKALEEYRNSIINYNTAFLDEFEDLFLGVF